MSVYVMSCYLVYCVVMVMICCVGIYYCVMSCDLVVMVICYFSLYYVMSWFVVMMVLSLFAIGFYVDMMSTIILCCVNHQLMYCVVVVDVGCYVYRCVC